MERDPNGVAPSTPGAKLDAGKEPVRRGLLEYFPRACLAVARVSAAGAAKYTWNGWETVKDGVDRYGDAEVRHICKAAIEGQVDPDFGELHAAHEAWNALARLELILRQHEQAAPVRLVPRHPALAIRPDVNSYTPKVGVAWGRDDPGDAG